MPSPGLGKCLAFMHQSFEPPLPPTSGIGGGTQFLPSFVAPARGAGTSLLFFISLPLEAGDLTGGLAGHSSDAP